MAGTPSSTTGRFRIWDLSASLYDHTELANDFNTIDALIGVEFAGARPIYNEIAALKQEREPLGTVKMWYRFTTNYSPPAGYVICDGVTTVGTNDLKDNSGTALPTSTLTPDLRGRVLVGANIAQTDGTGWTVGTGSTHAPGIGGVGGSNNNTGVTVNTPNHYHEFSHIHEVGPIAIINGSDGFETGSVVSGVGFGTSAANGSAFTAANMSHKHGINMYSSKSRIDTNENQKLSDVTVNSSAAGRTTTSNQYISTGGTNNNPTGGAAGDNLAITVSVDARPAGIGLLPIMKVKYVTVA